MQDNPDMLQKGKKLLFLRFSSLGDVVIANFTAMEIKKKHPEYELTWFVNTPYDEIVHAQPWVDDIIVWDKKRTGTRGYINILRYIRRRHFDIIVDMHATDRTCLLCVLAGVPVRYGVHKEYPFAHTSFDMSEIMDTSVKISNCKKYLCAPRYDSENLPKIPAGARTVGLAIGASFAVKRWPVKRWIEFCDIAEHEGYYMLLLGSGVDECAAAHEIESAVPDEKVINLAGKLSLGELVAVVGMSDVVVSGDTGIMHIARALGVPVAGLFGPNFPMLGEDYENSLGKKFLCKCPNVGCQKHECTRQCLEDIAASDVLEGVRELMGARKASKLAAGKHR